jgi:hypothetical protein
MTAYEQFLEKKKQVKKTDGAQPEVGEFKSKRGKPVTVAKTPLPDAANGTMQFVIRYGAGTAPGTSLYYADVPRLWGRVNRMIDNFLNDISSKGKPFKERKRQEK